jgi:hypothetical protein
VAIDPRNRYVFIGDDDGECVVVDVILGETVASWQAGSGLCAAVGTDDGWLCSHQDGTVARVSRDADDRTVITRTSPVDAFASRPRKAQLAWAHRDGTVTISDIAGSAVCGVRVDSALMSIAFHPTRPVVVATGARGVFALEIIE